MTLSATEWIILNLLESGGQFFVLQKGRQNTEEAWLYVLVAIRG